MTQIVSQLATGDLESSFGSNTIPNFEGVLGEWWLGDDAAASGLNSITGVVAAEIGDPLYSPGYATIGYPGGGEPNASGFLTDVGANSGGAVTILALVRNITGGAQIAPKDPGDAFSWLNYNFSGVAGPQRASMGNGHSFGATDQSVLPIGPDAAKFSLFMGVALLNTQARIFRTDAGGTVQDVAGELGFIPAVRNLSPLQIGGFFNVNNIGTFDVAALAFIAGNKGQAFIEELYPLWKAYAESRGVAVN